MAPEEDPIKPMFTNYTCIELDDVADKEAKKEKASKPKNLIKQELDLDPPVAVAPKAVAAPDTEIDKRNRGASGLSRRRSRR